MILRPVVVVALLLTFVGSNAELLRGLRREHPREQIRKLMMNKSTKADDEDNRDDINTQPPLPDPTPAATSPPATEAPNTGATSPPTTGTCLCTTLCQQCYSQGINTEPCQSVCAYANEPNCEGLCDAYLQGLDNRDDTNTQPPLPDDPTPPTCLCVGLCDTCEANGSHTAPCKTVCEFAELSNAECTTKCNAALHIGEP